MKKHSGESIRLFENPILESFSHVHPIIPLVVWSPFVIFLWNRAYKNGNTTNEFLLFALIGLVVWTLTEYVLHRFVFHWDAKIKLGKRVVFMFHGLHHDDPQDPTRLVMPPVPAILIMFLLWKFFALIVPAHYLDLFMSFFTVGYLCYDYIHYATHHFPMTNPIGKYLRKYHLQHHFSHERSKYGVSNPLWDYVFRTVRGPKDTH
jgi:sterol desaturase/sphingolipid hydroxylase (fatty acid hydroxylase superfamily)